jgi:hypothetical protein
MILKGPSINPIYNIGIAPSFFLDAFHNAYEIIEVIFGLNKPFSYQKKPIPIYRNSTAIEAWPVIANAPIC